MRNVFGERLTRFIASIALLLLSGCGTLEIGIEPIGIVNTPTSTVIFESTLTPEPPATSSSLTTPLPTDTITPSPFLNVDEWALYQNQNFNISFKYPNHWELIPGYSTYGDMYAGDDGFFILYAARGDAIDILAGTEADHRLRPYGSQPTIEITRIQGQQARFIWPSDDANMEGQSSLIVKTPLPVDISGNSFSYFIIYANQEYMRTLAETIRFTDGSVSETDATDFWMTADIPQDKLVTLLVQPENAAHKFGDIATVHADGTDLKVITSYNYNADPVLSPDGQRIAYRSVPSTITSLPDPGSRLQNGAFNIWVITVDGRQAWQLTQNEDVRSIPTWSTDSDRVAFSQGAIGELIEVGIDTKSYRSLTAGAFSPKYRPDGNGIGYITQGGGLAWLDENGVEHRIVSPESIPGNARVYDFDWLPTGQQLVYTVVDESIQEATFVENSLFIVTVDGSSVDKLADNVRSARVSANGQMIAILQGSGYGDACFVDSQLQFLPLTLDLDPLEITSIGEFDGYPQMDSEHSFYPLTNVTWVSNRLAFVEFELTCDADRSVAGRYLIDPFEQHMVQVMSVDNE